MSPSLKQEFPRQRQGQDGRGKKERLPIPDRMCRFVVSAIIVNVERPTKDLLLLAESLCRSLLLSELALRPHTVNSSNNYGYSPDIIANKQTQAPRAAWDIVFMQSFYEVDDLRHSPLHHSCVNLFGLAHRGLPLTQLPSGLSQAETKHMHYG